MHQRRDNGSVLLALLLSVTLLALIGATLSIANASLSTTRHEGRYDSAIQTADAGVQNALLGIRQLPVNSSQTSLSGTVVLNGANETWTAIRDSTSTLVWKVTSTATATSKAGAQKTARTVSAQIIEPSLFSYAAFADSSINFNGNNGSTSYPTAGFGDLGTNGTLNLKNNSAIDGHEYVFDSSAQGSSGRCTGNCSVLTYEPQRLNIKSAASSTGFIGVQIAACKAAQGGTLPPFVGTSIAGGHTYCFSSFDADTQNFIVTGGQPAIIYVDGGDVTLGNKNHSNVNNDIPGAPTSIQLQIYSTGTTVSTYNQSALGAAVYAPNAACGGAGSNAATDFYGSLVCNTIDNVGGWTFHYDTRLAGIGSGDWNIQHYAEK